MSLNSHSDAVAEAGCRAIDGLASQHDLLEAAGELAWLRGGNQYDKSII